MKLLNQNSLTFVLALTLWFQCAVSGVAQPSTLDPQIAIVTNGPAVMDVVRHPVTSYVPRRPFRQKPPPETLPPEIREAFTAFVLQVTPVVTYWTNQLFDHYLPDSLDYFVWTNVIAHTNGRSTIVWSIRQRPPNWPASPPAVQWNTQGLMWGMKGLTALSPSWENEGAPGQVPITALTRRHGYSRGHSMGADGSHTQFAGKKVWFVTTDNQVVEVKVLREVVRTGPASGRDYTILLFDRDLPPGIEPIRVATIQGKYIFASGGPTPIFQTEQGGQVGAGIPGFIVDIWKGGDSGSPNLLPLPGELAFCGGRSTSGASREMQADMDELCRLQGLDAKKYQLQWVDLSRFPSY
jgi:hypothetical protein